MYLKTKKLFILSNRKHRLYPLPYKHRLITRSPHHVIKSFTRSCITTTQHQRQTHEGKRLKEDTGRLLYNYIYLSVYCKVRKGCLRFACERVLETEHKLHILTPLLWPSRCVFIVLLMLGSTPSGLSEGPLGLVWPSLPHLVSNPLGVCWQLLWDPNSTELNNNSTPTRSPTGSLKSNV